jgi:hypothetical protein
MISVFLRLLFVFLDERRTPANNNTPALDTTATTTASSTQ